MEKARSRKKRPWYLRYQYRRIMAFMLMVAMLFVDVGNNAAVAYGAVAKEKVRVHAQIDSEAVVDTLIATGGYGIGFDDAIGDYLLSNASSPVQGQYVYDQLLEEVTGENRHLIAQRRVGGLGLFLIAQNETEDFVYPDDAYLDETFASKAVFSLFSKGELILDEDAEEDTLDESDIEEFYGGNAEQRKAVADTIEHLMLLAVNLDSGTNYEVRANITGDELAVLEGKLITTSYKEKKNSEEDAPVVTVPEGSEDAAPSESTEAVVETPEVPEESSTAGETQAPADESTPAEDQTETSQEAAESTEAPEETTAAETTAAETTAAETTEAETTEAEVTEAETTEAAETEAPTAEIPDADVPMVETPETEAPAADDPVQSQVEIVDSENSEGGASIEEHDVPTVQSALTIDIPAADDSEGKEEAATGSVVEIVPEDVPMASVPAEQPAEETSAEVPAETVTEAASEAEPTEAVSTETESEAVESTEETTEAAAPEETLPEETLPEETAEVVETTAPEETTAPSVSEDEDSTQIIDDDVLEVTIKVEEKTLKQSELKSMFAEKDGKATPSEATPSEAEGGFKMTVKPYTAVMLDLVTETGNMTDDGFGTLYIENNSEENVAYQVKLSNEESAEPVLYNGEVTITSLSDETAEGTAKQVEEGILYLDPNTAAAIEELPSDTQYEVDILPSQTNYMLSDESDQEAAEAAEPVTFADGTTKVRGVIGDGASLSLKAKNGSLTISVVDESGRGASGIPFTLKKSDNRGTQSGTTNSDGTVRLAFTGFSKDSKIELYMGKDNQKVASYTVESSRWSGKTLKPTAYESDLGEYTIDDQSTSLQSSIENPILYIKKVKPELTITPTIQGMQVPTSFSYLLEYEDGTPYAGPVEGATVVDGRIAVEPGETVKILGTDLSEGHGNLIVTAIEHDTHTLNRTIKNGALVSGSVTYDGGHMELSYSYRASVESAGGVKVTKQANQTSKAGVYDVTLTVTGEPKKVEQLGNVSVVLVLDKSGSMADDMNGNEIGGWWNPNPNPSRNSIMVDAVNTMVKDILGESGSDSGNEVGIVTYSTEARGSRWFTSNSEGLRRAINYEVSGSTNCEDAFIKAKEMLESANPNSQKFVVYLSDGEANYYVGASSQKDDKEGKAYAAARAVEAAKQLRQEYPEVTIMTLGVSSAPGTAVLAPQGADKYWDSYAKVTDKDAFKDAFKAITDIIKTSQERPKVDDFLGDNVKLVSTSTIKTFMETLDNSGNVINTSNEGNATYNSSYKEITWDVITSKGKPDELETLKERFVLQYQVEVIDPSKPYEGTGQDNTGSHTGEDGWWSNKEAKLYCNDSTTYATAEFPLPVVRNTLPTSLFVKKVDKTTNAPLSGAEFKVEREDKSAASGWSTYATIRTNENGIAEVTGLSEGRRYRLTETKAPDNYQLDETPYYVTVIKRNNSGVVDVYETDADGNVKYPNKPITSTAPLVITNETNTITIGENGNFKVVKALNGADKISDTLKDFTFTMTGAKGNLFTASITDMSQDTVTLEWINGIGQPVTEIPYDVYTISETSSGSYFQLSKAEATNAFGGKAQVNADNTVTLTVDESAKSWTSANNVIIFTNEPTNSGTLTINKKAEDAKGNEQFTFNLYESKNDPSVKKSVTITVNSKGEGTGTFEDLTLGQTYYIKEADHTYYKLDSLTDTSTNTSLKSEGDGFYSFVLGTNGSASMTVNAVNDRVKDAMNLTVIKKITGGQELNAEEKTFTFTMEGPDGEKYTGTAQIADGTTANVTWSPELPAVMKHGTYTITESSDNGKFNLDHVYGTGIDTSKKEKEATFTFNASNTTFAFTFVNNVNTDGKITVKKVLQNAVSDADKNKQFRFNLYADANKQGKVGTITVSANDVNGKSFESLPLGKTYYLEEVTDAAYDLVSVVNGTTLVTATNGLYPIRVTDNSSVQIQVTNKAKTFNGNLLINKVVSGTSLLNANPGDNSFTFTLTDPDNVQKSFTVQLETIQKGTATGKEVSIPAPADGWKQGTYTLTETDVNDQADNLNNYVLSVGKDTTSSVNASASGKTITFTIDGNNVGATGNLTVVAQNTLDSVSIGTATLKKTVTSGAELVPTEGFTFIVTAPNGKTAKISVTKADLDKTMKITEQLTSVFGNKLPLGTYTISEAEDKIFELDGKIQVTVGDRPSENGFTLTKADDGKSISITAANKTKASNRKLSVEKVLNETGILNAESLRKNFTFTMTMPGGKTLNGTYDLETKQINWTENGQPVNLSTMELPYGTYTITETSESNYTTSAKVRGIRGSSVNENTVTFTLKKSVGDYVGNTVTVTFTNTPKSGNITFNKVESLGNKALSGAEFTLYQGTGENKEEIAKAYSDDKGIVTFSKVAYGNYTVVETQAPAGYQLSNTEYSVTVNAANVALKDGAGNTVNTVTNAPIQHKISVKKTFEANDAGITPEATFGLYDAPDAEKPLQEVSVTGNATETFPDLVDPGTYWVREISVTSGYEKETEAQEVTVATSDSEEAVEVTFENQLKTYGTGNELTIKKVLESGEWLIPEDGKEFTFQILDKDGKNVASATATVEQGDTEATVTVEGAKNLKVYTTYYLQENADQEFNFVSIDANGVTHFTNTAPFYLEPGENLKPDENNEITVTNTVKVNTGVALTGTKVIANGSSEIAAESFGVRLYKAFGDTTGELVATGTTVEMNQGSESFIFTGFDGTLEPGNYKVVEFAPGIATQFTQVGQPIVMIDGEKVSADNGIFFVPAGTKTIDIQITNTPSTTKGGLEVTKRFENGQSLADGKTFQFTLTKNDAPTVTYKGSITYNSKAVDNKVVWEATNDTLLTDLQLGEYTLTETSEDYVYLEIPVVIDSVGTTKYEVDAVNKAKSDGTLTVYKTFAENANLLEDTTFNFTVNSLDTPGLSYGGSVTYTPEDVTAIIAGNAQPKAVTWTTMTLDAETQTTLTKLPYGTYQIAEDSDLFDVTFAGADENGIFTISSTAKDVTLTATNTAKTVSGTQVTLTKEIAERSPAAQNEMFNFKLYDVTYGDYIPDDTPVATANGVAENAKVTFSVGNRNYEYIVGHTYKVVEEPSDYYELVGMTGNASAVGVQEYTFTVNSADFTDAITVTNTAKTIDISGDDAAFKVVKALENPGELEKGGFQFTMTGAGSKKTYTASVKEMTGDTVVLEWFDSEGQKVEKLPYDVYTIEETNSGTVFQLTDAEATGFGTSAVVKDLTAAVTVNDASANWTNATVTFTNAPNANGKLEITKQVTGDTTFEGDTFTFRLFEKTGTGYAGLEESVTIEAGETGTFGNLVLGKTYAIKEDASDNYQLEGIRLNGTGQLSETSDGFYEFVLTGNEEVLSAIATNSHRTGSMTVAKAVEGINPRPNEEFKINLKPAHETFVSAMTSLKAGQTASVDKLIYGETYTVSEIMSDWFVQTKVEIVDKNGNVQNISEDFTFTMSEAYEGATIRVTNEAAVSNTNVTVNKVLTGGYSLAKGQTFNLALKDANGTVVYQTTLNGEDVAAAEDHLLHAFTVQNLAYGTYTIEETTNSNVFEQQEIQMQDIDGMDDVMVVANGEFTIAPGSTDKVITVVNAPKADGELVVEKVVTDEKMAELVNGETFTFTINSAENNGFYAIKEVTYQKGGDNTVTFKNLPYGSYTITEGRGSDSLVELSEFVGAPNGQFIVNGPTAVSLTANNDPRTGTNVTAAKVIADNNFKYEDDTFTFLLKDMNGNVLSTSTMEANKDGVTFKDADGKDFVYTYGYTYQIEELALKDYELLSYKVNGLAVANGQFTYTGQDIAITVENTVKRGSLTITKVDAENADVTLAGVEFELYPGHLDSRPNGLTRIWNAITGDEVYKGITDEHGVLTFENIPVGEYTLFETKTDASYVLPENGQIVIVNENAETELTVENTRKAVNAELTIKKTIDGKGLEGRTFHFDLYRDGSDDKVIATGIDVMADGSRTRSGELQAGLYYIVEETGADYTVSYKDDKAVRYSQFNPEQMLGQQEVTVGETTETRFYFDVTAENADELVVEALNTIKRADNFTMIAKELWSAEDFAVNVPETMDFDFQLQQEINGVYTTIAEGKITGQTEAVSSESAVEIQWTMVNDTKATASPSDGASGVPTVLGNLEYGKYRMVEAVPENFTLDEVALHLADISWNPYADGERLVGFEFTLDETMTFTYGNQAVLQFNNSMNYQGRPEGDGGLVFSKVNAADHNQKLSGAEFTLYRATRDADSEVAVFASDSTGTVTIKGAAPGKYYLQETKAPAGYELSDTMITFTVTAEGRTVDVTGLAGGEGAYYFTNTKTPSIPDGGGGGTSGGGGGGGSATPVTIVDQDIPLAPPPGDNTVIIPDEEIPLAPLPKTGDRASASGKLTALLSGLLFAAYTMLASRKKEEDN